MRVLSIEKYGNIKHVSATLLTLKTSNRNKYISTQD
jgi:hypothetical protein